MSKIVPNLWFDTQAEEAANFYVSLFENSKTGEITRYTEASSSVAEMPVGMVMTVAFELEGQEYVAINGGPIFQFSEAVSFMIRCKSQSEVDDYWSKLTADGGEESQCGWLKAKFGFSWQVVPERLYDLLRDSNKAKSEAVTTALMQMRKIELPVLEEAARSA